MPAPQQVSAAPQQPALSPANAQEPPTTIHATIAGPSFIAPHPQSGAPPPRASNPPPTNTCPIPFRESAPSDLTPTQSKSSPPKRRKLMLPTGPALDHPAAPLLQTYAREGCPANVQEPFSLQELEAAIARGAHPSACEPEAAKALLAETKDKVAKGYARLIPWDDLKKSLPSNIRISPIAAIPHKSRAYRMILDLSYMFNIDGTLWPSVNMASNPQDPPLNAMTQLGQVIPRLVHAIATSPEDQGPWVFIKLDIKDGFWRMMVPEADEFNFCYVMPRQFPTEPIQLVVPSALQMGWTYSPPYFCAATETARDVAEALSNKPALPPHPLEEATINKDDALLLHQLENPSTWHSSELPTKMQSIARLLEIYVDDFTAALQCTHPQVLLHHSRALLHGIHSVFPPAPHTSTNPDDEPVSLKKLQEGEGVWAFRKEILGWIFDGINRTIELPPGKLDKIRQTVKKLLLRQHASVPEFQSTLGKLQHAAIGIPNGKGLLSPLFRLLPTEQNPSTRRKHVQLPAGSEAHEALKDLRTMLKMVANRPTKCAQLIPGWPNYVGFCDACKWGAGGVWLSGSDDLHPVMWRVKWPPDITKRLVSPSNPAGDLTINDLEMAGLLLQQLVLEDIAPTLEHKHAATWCDNSSTVSWARRLSSKRSLVGQRLVRALSLRHVVTKCSPLAPWSIAGANNKMADLASRSFSSRGGPGNFDLTDAQLLTKFNRDFPLTQEAFWHMHRLPNKLTSLVYSELRLERQPMGSWLRLTTHGKSSGRTGQSSSSKCLASANHSSQPTTPRNSLPSSKPLPLGFAMETRDEKIRLALSEFNKRWQPSARPSNWLENPAPRSSIKRTKSTGQPSNGK